MVRALASHARRCYNVHITKREKGNEMYDEMDRIVQRRDQIEHEYFGMPGKPLPDEERKELKELQARLQELKAEDDKRVSSEHVVSKNGFSFKQYGA